MRINLEKRKFTSSHNYYYCDDSYDPHVGDVGNYGSALFCNNNSLVFKLLEDSEKATLFIDSRRRPGWHHAYYKSFRRITLNGASRPTIITWGLMDKLNYLGFLPGSTIYFKLVKRR